METPTAKAAHSTEYNDINQLEITNSTEILPPHSASRVVPIYPSAITYAPDNYGHRSEVSIL